MGNQYAIMLNKHQHEHDNFEGIGACIAKQFEQEMFKKLGVSGFDEVVHLGWGMFCRKDRLDDYKAMIERQHKELDDAIKADQTGAGFVKDMFYYELANHECQLTGDPTDALMALGYSIKQVREDKVLFNGYQLAINELMKEEI